MNNNWLQLLIPKVKVHVNNLSEIVHLRTKKVRIYRVRKVEEGYIITIRRGALQNTEVIGHQSIYRTIGKFILPVALVWSLLLVAIQFITIDYEIRGNLIPEEVALVGEIIEPHFLQVGPLAFFHSNNDELAGNIAAAFHDYIWIDIQVVGSRLVINIFDTQVTEPESSGKQIDTIYARVSGVVTEVNAKGCRVLVEIDQVVDIGEPLISCYTPTGFGTDFAPIEGSATGIVYANVWYEISIEFPREYAVRMVTGSGHSNLFLNFGNTRIRVWGTAVDYTDFSERNSIFNPLSLFNIAPITLERVHYYEKSDIILTNEIEAVREQADELIEGQLAHRLDGDFELLELEFLNLIESNDMVRLVYLATVRENIATTLN